MICRPIMLFPRHPSYQISSISNIISIDIKFILIHININININFKIARLLPLSSAIMLLLFHASHASCFMLPSSVFRLPSSVFRLYGETGQTQLHFPRLFSSLLQPQTTKIENVGHWTLMICTAAVQHWISSFIT